MSVLDRFTLTDRVAIVTGASSDLGVHAAVGLAEAGADVVVVARRAERLEATRQQVEATGRRCVAVAGDVADPDTAARIVDAAVEAFGKVDVLLNNAGVGTAVPALVRLSGSSVRSSMSTLKSLTGWPKPAAE